VLGTTFNVNGYADERDIKTTLLEGSVRVTEAEAQVTGIAHVGVNTNMSKLSVVLKPGQQAQLVVGENTNNGGGDGDMKIKLLTNQAQDQIVAWKNGLFNFTGADLETVMRQLARWYDVEVVYERDIPKMKFVGEMQRELNLLDVLDVLKRTDVHFRIEGRKIIVLP
jgi:ferric-dicitrate binding protein FerR (iron transport regulator)